MRVASCCCMPPYVSLSCAGAIVQKHVFRHRTTDLQDKGLKGGNFLWCNTFTLSRRQLFQQQANTHKLHQRCKCGQLRVMRRLCSDCTAVQLPQRSTATRRTSNHLLREAHRATVTWQGSACMARFHTALARALPSLMRCSCFANSALPSPPEQMHRRKRRICRVGLHAARQLRQICTCREAQQPGVCRHKRLAFAEQCKHAAHKVAASRCRPPSMVPTRILEAALPLGVSC